MNKQLLNEVNKITKGIVIFDIVILVVLVMIGNFTQQTVTGLAFGSIIAILNLRLMGISIEKSVGMKANKAQVYLASQYSIRMAIMAVVLFTSATMDHMDIITTVIGLLSTKFVVLTNKFIIEKIIRKEA